MTGPEIFNFDQGSDEWLSIRSGMPTASEFRHVIAKKGPRGGVPAGRQKLLWRLAAEQITGEPERTYCGPDMLRGKEREAEARSLYALLKDADPVLVGFIRNGNCGCSPDALIGADGMLEIKDAIGSIQIERLLAGTLPPEHVAQCQGALMVAEREWLDFMSYCRAMPPLIVRVYRDEPYVNALRADVAEFVDELDALVAQIRSM